MSDDVKLISLGLNLDDYRYDSRHYPGQSHSRLIDYNYVQGVDFSYRCPSWLYTSCDAYGAEGRCNIVYGLLTGRLDYASPTVRDVAYRCFLCGSCDVAGKRNLDLELQLMLESLRVRLVENGYGPLPQHVNVTKIIEDSRNRFGKHQAERLNWIIEDAPPENKADILYFVGCRSSLEDAGIACATARILNTVGVPFMLLDDEPCCGQFVYSIGQVKKAQKIAEEVLASIRKSRVRTVVFSCSECYKTIKVDYPKILGIATSDLGFEVKHITELANEWVKLGKLKLKNRLDMKVTYHDPSSLGRLSEPWHPWQGVRRRWGIFDPPRKMRRGVHGVYEPPRKLLRAIPGMQLVEMVRHHENAFCAGEGGGVKEAYPEFADWTARERLREARATGADAVVSCSPECKNNLCEASNGVKIYDITELIEIAITK